MIKLLFRNLGYHWRGNFAVFLGIVLGSAVLTGALLVGDSLRGSLKSLTLDQLGWVEDAMVPGRFFRAALANDISAERRSAVLLLQGSVSRKIDDKETQRAGRVTIFGIDASFWPKEKIPEGAEFWAGNEREIVLNQTLARALGARVGDSVTLLLQRADNVPGETLLGKRKIDEVTDTLGVKVRQILADEGMARFSLKPTPEPVRNAFLPIRVLQKKLDLAGQANALLAAQAKPTLQVDLPGRLTLEDWGLRVRAPRDRAQSLIKLLDPNDFDEGRVKKIRWNGRLQDELARAADANKKLLTRDLVQSFVEKHYDYALLESRRTILEPVVVAAALKVGAKEKAEASFPAYAHPILISLADSISDGRAEIPYAIVAGVDTKRMFQKSLADDEIVFVEAPDSPLKVKVDDWLTVSYFSPDEKNHLEKKTRKFQVKMVPKAEGVFDDPDLAPEFPGITDKLDIANWENPPFPFDHKRARQIEQFWKRYRTTPRAYVNLKIAKELWGSRFGDLTALQIVGHGADARQFPQALLAELRADQGGFVFQPVREQAIRASSGATDFGELFLYFSFFLIVSALLLVGLLVRLNIDRRAGEMGLLLATGWSHAQVRRLLLGEGTLLAVVGGLVGLGGALLYGDLMLKLLAANWPGGDSLNFMRLHAEPASFAIGYLASFLVSVLTLVWATRVLSKLSPRSLLSGETTATTGATDAAPGWSRWLVPAGILGALALAGLAPFLRGHEAQAGSFFGSGALLLTACIAGAWNGLKQSSRTSSPQPTLTKLGVRNAGRHAVRSVLTIGLLAAASFLIVAVESFHKDTDHSFLLKTGGSGGFAFLAEGSVPVYEDLNQPQVREDQEFGDQLKGVSFYPCRVQPGDDASCLNLYKPLKPRVLGVPQTLIERGGFHFGATQAETEAEKANPWLLLRKPSSDDAIPAIVDANTAEWILKVKLGGTIAAKNDHGQNVTLRVVALLQESIFQSEVLVADAEFVKLYPRQTGFSFFLIDAGESDANRLAGVEKELGKSMEKLGMDVQTTTSRLQGYLAVENMYLATFQALGGLGLLLGAAGLAIVLLRGVWERRAELALLQALGFRSGQLAWLVLAENAFLLVLGLAAGTVSALLAVAPHLIGSGAQVLWLRIAVLLVSVLLVGLLSALLAVAAAARTPVLTALRRE